MKKSLLIGLLPLLLLTSCHDDSTHDHHTFTPKTSYTKEEQKSVGLEGLELPSEVKEVGTFDQDTAGWIMSFSYPGSLDEHNSYADTVFAYLSSHYDNGYYGKKEYYGYTKDNTLTFCNLTTVKDKQECFDTNPVPRYLFYYATSKEEDKNGYLPEKSVYQITLDYDEGKVKFFLEYASDSQRSKTLFKPNPLKEPQETEEKK